MFHLTVGSQIYIVAPPYTASGGPELLHQLCAILNQKGFHAFMFYREKLKKSQIYEKPVPERFLHYNTPFIAEIEDSKENLLIVPETITRPLIEYKNIQKCEWWLAANNYFWIMEINSHKYLTFAYHCLQFLLGKPTPLSFNTIKKQNVIHIAQCWYIVSHLRSKGLHNVAYLSDYLGEEHFEHSGGQHSLFAADMREDIILYNPNRNTKYVKHIKEAFPDFEFIAIENMTPQQVIALMKKAKIYADFGAHPGKDRLPREAAMCGCCILTSTLGSADFYDDVPISHEFKFERKRKNIKHIAEKIKYIFENYEGEREKFNQYRDFIRNEKKQFEKDVDKIFKLDP